MGYAAAMIASSSTLRRIAFATILLAPAGCASQVGPASRMSYARETCPDLNASIGDTSKTITAVAVRRGKVDRLNIPFWVPGGEKAVTIVKNRQTRKIGRLETDLDAMRGERQDRCR
jgi:hypothetical protein